MARLNRRELFDPHEVSVMHCINRAVRRAMLCGVDHYSGKSYEHLRNLPEKTKEPASIMTSAVNGFVGA